MTTSTDQIQSELKLHDLPWCFVWMVFLRLTVKSIAEDTEISRVSVGRYMRGDRVPDAVNAAKIAKAMKLPVAVVFPSNDEQRPLDVFGRFLLLVWPDIAERVLPDRYDTMSRRELDDEAEQHGVALDGLRRSDDQLRNALRDDAAARERYYRRQDADAYEPLELVVNGRLMREQVPEWFAAQMPQKRTGPRRRGAGRPAGAGRPGARRSSSASRGSPDDDPGEPEPPRRSGAVR